MDTTDPTRRAADAPEFPGYANVYESRGEAVPLDADPAAAALDRRRFLALSAAVGAAAAGCRRPDLEILPYSAVPDDQVGHLVAGKPTFYATSLPRPGGALPVLVESHDGRPTKVEGNPQHSASGGATDVFAQAAVFDLYSPDRVMSDKYPGVMEKGAARRWTDFDRLARGLAEQLGKTQGEGFAVLTDQAPSPALRLIGEHVRAKFPKAAWHTYEPVDASEALRGTEIAFGQKLLAKYDFTRLNRVLALDSDFLGGCDPDSVENGRAFAGRRKADAMNRLYVVESTYTVTGTMADHRLRLPASQVGSFLLAVARELKATRGGGLVDTAVLPDLPDPGAALPGKWVKAVAADLDPLTSAVVVGHRQPAWVHALAHAVNVALRADRRVTDFFVPRPGGKPNPPAVTFRPAPPEVTERGVRELAADMSAGKVNTLLAIGGNPALNAPADTGFRAALRKVATKVRLGLFFDHTSEACDWHLPLAHPLESWGDAETTDGTLCCVQPLIAPLNGGKSATDAEPPRGGRTAFEVLSLLTAFPGPDGKPVGSFAAAQKAASAAVRKVFADRAELGKDETADAAFNRYKQLGFLPAAQDKGARKPQAVTVKVDAVAKAVAGYKPPPTRDALEVTFHPSYALFDGRFATNPWLQELPDPVTKLVWDNAAVVSPKTAAEFGLRHGDVVKLTANGAAVDIPVYILPGQTDFSVALSYGQAGEVRIDHVPSGGGTNVFPLRTTAGFHTATGCTLEKTGRTADLVATQEHGVIPDGRDIIRDVTLAGLSHDAKPGAHPTEDDLRKGFQGGYGNPQQPPAPAREKQARFPLDLARPELLDSQFQWGMTIDLNACTGCTTCLIACQAENNIPVVGKGEVKRNRELHWIRIDRYFSSDGHAADADPRVVSQPVACVHCEAAPCEQVCPVNAAVHSPEGLNLQVYNRCIGTRYCANACPYKVRRFNWFDFNKRGLDELRTPPPLARGGSSLTENLLPESLKMGKNPDVSVRMRGVMEKCTYCVQRIERGKYGAKIAATEVAQGRRAVEVDPAYKSDGPATAYRKPKDPLAAGYDLDKQGRVVVPDGLIVTACEAACPTGAITFGNVLDPDSRVSRAKRRAGEYLLLGELNTKPRTSYLPRVRNPNPELA
ncbi:MAG: molybdopterin oxidoreductase [Isosphaera sp.]|nr:molybdopterin oxidoreductase [Isosphaera sp.]